MFSEAAATATAVIELVERSTDRPGRLFVGGRGGRRLISARQFIGGWGNRIITRARAPLFGGRRRMANCCC